MDNINAVGMDVQKDKTEFHSRRVSMTNTDTDGKHFSAIVEDGTVTYADEESATYFRNFFSFLIRDTDTEE